MGREHPLANARNSALDTLPLPLPSPPESGRTERSRRDASRCVYRACPCRGPVASPAARLPVSRGSVGLAIPQVASTSRAVGIPCGQVPAQHFRLWYAGRDRLIVHRRALLVRLGDGGNHQQKTRRACARGPALVHVSCRNLRATQDRGARGRPARRLISLRTPPLPPLDRTGWCHAARHVSRHGLLLDVAVGVLPQSDRAAAPDRSTGRARVRRRAPCRPRRRAPADGGLRG